MNGRAAPCNWGAIVSPPEARYFRKGAYFFFPFFFPFFFAAFLFFLGMILTSLPS